MAGFVYFSICCIVGPLILLLLIIASTRRQKAEESGSVVKKAEKKETEAKGSNFNSKTSAVPSSNKAHPVLTVIVLVVVGLMLFGAVRFFDKDFEKKFKKSQSKPSSIEQKMSDNELRARVQDVEARYRTLHAEKLAAETRANNLKIRLVASLIAAREEIQELKRKKSCE